MKADIASIVSLLIQQPRALQKHPRLLVTMRKRILGQSPTASCCWHMWRHAEYCTQTSHVQQLKLQTCSLWFSILISESLPLVTVVWWIVMARVSPIVALHPDMGDMGAVSELGGSYQRCWREFQDRHWRQPKEPANPHASLHVPHASLYGFLRSCLTRVAASVILCACCAVRCEGELSERISSIQYLGTWEDESIYWPRALQKHPRLLVTMQKRIVGKSPAVCARGAMLNAQTSHVQQFKLCSLWFSILISESLPLLTVWRAVKARVSLKTRYFSELVDRVDVAECSGNVHDWVVLREIQGKCAGQITRWLVVSSRTRFVECQPAQWHASCASFRSSRSFRCFDAGKAHCITAFEKGCPFPTVPDHCKAQSLERSSCYIVLIVLWSSWQFM